MPGMPSHPYMLLGGRLVITDLLLGLFQGLVSLLLAPFPSASPGDVADYLGTVVGNLGALNYFLPIAETFALVVAVFALFPIFLGITLSLWVAAQLRGSSSVG
jgi:hypothetical protein